ncbi:MAG TPA: DUF5123 domain-containing protein, partial [Chitinophagaceae bacterium]
TITFTNSTIYKAEKVITSKNNSSKILIANCTFNEVLKGGSSYYFIDYSTSGTNEVSGGIEINNSIVGIGKVSGDVTAIRGIRVGAGTAITVSNTYKTSDYTIQALQSPIPNLIPYNGTSTDLWQDPYNGDFRIKDATFAGKSSAGDPRWRP